MAETRYREVYQDGRLVGNEPYEVSEGQLEMEKAEDSIRTLAAKADNELTVPEIARFVKALGRLR